MLRSLPTPAREAALPALLATLGVLELVAVQPPRWGYAIALVVGACALLVGRRRYPLTLATSAFLVVLALPWVGPELNELSIPIPIGVVAVYALARWVPDLRGLIGVVVVLLVFLLDFTFVDERDQSWADVVFVSAIVTPPYVFGRVTRRLAEQGELLLVQQEQVKHAAVREERERIARELHDVIAHTVSAMVVQVAAAQDLLVTDPDRAARVLDDAAAAGRKALAETGRLLHVVRDDADELGLDPAPGLADLPALVSAFRERGLDVDLHVEDDPAPLPAGLDVSAYRIVEEALTNALRYAADRTALLRLTRTPTSLQIHASNATAGAASVGSSLGLVGMAERVSVFGGTLTYGATPHGRFELNASLPVPESAAVS